jgi:hypothetical protein
MNKVRIIRMTVLIAGIYFVVVFLIGGIWKGSLDEGVFNKITPVYTDVIRVIGLFAIGVGVVNIWMVHTHRIVRGRLNWEHSIVLLAAFCMMFTFAVLKWTGPQPEPGQPYEGVAGLFDYVVTRIMVHMNSTIYSFLAFFVTSAALRAFRVRGVESAVMMVGAVIVLLSMAPETGFPFLFEVRERLDAWLNAAVFRALTFGMLLGSITVAVRMWLGVERSALFEAS